jgi:uncharacterized protein YbaR (Trm112 family)
MIAKELLDVLCCPETKEDVSVVESSMVDKINSQIAVGKVKNRSGKPVSEKIDGALVRKDRKFLYLVREDIPIMLIDEALPMAQFE